MIAQRTLAVLAAVMLVCAAALAMIGPRSVSLGRALANWDGRVEDTLKGWVLGVFGPWVWTEMVVPLLVRPAWLLPASLGIVFAGLSLSLAYRNTASQSHRRS